MRVSLLITCVVDVVAPDVADATVRLLRAAGCVVTCNLDQTCCGQPGWNAGFADDAAAVARTTLAALEAELDDGADLVVAQGPGAWRDGVLRGGARVQIARAARRVQRHALHVSARRVREA